MKPAAGKSGAPRAVRQPDTPGVRAAKAVFWWVCVPALIAFIGYRFVGPSIGRVPEIKKGAQKMLANSVEQSETPDSNDAVSDASKPTIDISVEKGAPRTKPQPEQKPRRSRRNKPKPADTGETRSTAPREDPASGDGATPPPEGDPASGAGGDGAGRGDGLYVRLPVA